MAKTDPVQLTSREGSGVRREGKREKEQENENT